MDESAGAVENPPDAGRWAKHGKIDVAIAVVVARHRDVIWPSPRRHCVRGGLRISGVEPLSRGRTPDRSIRQRGARTYGRYRDAALGEETVDRDTRESPTGPGAVEVGDVRPMREMAEFMIEDLKCGPILAPLQIERLVTREGVTPEAVEQVPDHGRDVSLDHRRRDRPYVAVEEVTSSRQADRRAGRRRLHHARGDRPTTGLGAERPSGNRHPDGCRQVIRESFHPGMRGTVDAVAEYRVSCRASVMV